MMDKKTFSNIDEYIALYPKPVQQMMESVRKAIRKIVPDAVECISYQIPTFKWNGKNLVHFAAYKNHIGFYPGAGGIAAFQDEINHYKNAKGSVQFPLDEPLPLDLIQRITAFRLAQNKGKAKVTKQPKHPTSKDFMELLSAPAQRALQHEGIQTLQQLAQYNEKTLLKLHGFGKASLPILRDALAKEGLALNS